MMRHVVIHALYYGLFSDRRRREIVSSPEKDGLGQKTVKVRIKVKRYICTVLYQRASHKYARMIYKLLNAYIHLNDP